MLGKIEDMLIVRMKEIVAENDLNAAVDCYDGELDEDDLARAAQFSPGFWVMVGSLSAPKRVGRNFHFDMACTVLAAQHATKRETARKGGHGKRVLGATVMADYVLVHLSGFKPDAFEKPLEPVSVTNFLNATVKRKMLSIMAVQFKARVAFSPEDAAAALDNFETLYHETIPANGSGTAAAVTEAPVYQEDSPS